MINFRIHQHYVRKFPRKIATATNRYELKTDNKIVSPLKTMLLSEAKTVILYPKGINYAIISINSAFIYYSRI